MNQSPENRGGGGVRPPRGLRPTESPSVDGDVRPDETDRRTIGARSRLTAHPAIGAPIRPPGPRPIHPEIHVGIRLRGSQGFGG